MTRRAVLLALALLVGAYYLLCARAMSYRFEWRDDLYGYYNYLGRAFAHGHLYIEIEPSPGLLALPDPYDANVDRSITMRDMAFFRGRYYLYHGAVPAVLLFAPWWLITGHDAPEPLALALFCFGARPSRDEPHGTSRPLGAAGAVLPPGMSARFQRRISVDPASFSISPSHRYQIFSGADRRMHIPGALPDWNPVRGEIARRADATRRSACIVHRRPVVHRGHRLQHAAL